MRIRFDTIGARLSLAFGLLIAIVLAFAGAGAWLAGALSRDLGTTARVDLVVAHAGSELQQRAGVVAAASRELLLVDSAGQIRRQRAAIDAALSESTQALKTLQALAVDAGWSEPAVAVQASMQAYAAAVRRFLELQQQGAADEARAALLVEVLPVQQAYQKTLTDLAATVEAATLARAESGRQMAERSVVWLVALGGAAAALAALATVVISRSITRPLQSAVQAARAIEAGNLCVELDRRGRGEIGELLRAMASMQDRLRDTIAGVVQTARDVALSSDELAGGNAELSNRTERAAGNLQQAASAMEQISATVMSSRERSQEAASVARGARDSVQQGGEAMDRLVQTMSRIAASSARIQDITDVIDGLAFQTNILALNAAVEAARAGEQGRGFAVVASEVRSLAARSATASREIKALILEAANGVDEGNATVQDVGARIRAIVADVMSVGQLIDDVSSAAQEQATGISSVNAGVSDLDRATQQNAALVEEIAATAETLKSGARRLVDSVAFFRIDPASA